MRRLSDEVLPRVRQLPLQEGELRSGLQDGAKVQRMLDEMPLNQKRIAGEWLVFVACLLVGVGLAIAISQQAPDAAAADAAAWIEANSRGFPAPGFSVLNRASHLPFWRLSVGLLLMLYTSVCLVRSVFWAVKTLGQPAVPGSPEAPVGVRRLLRRFLGTED
jgi:hypothetical protein